MDDVTTAHSHLLVLNKRTHTKNKWAGGHAKKNVFQQKNDWKILLFFFSYLIKSAWKNVEKLCGNKAWGM